MKMISVSDVVVSLVDTSAPVLDFPCFAYALDGSPRRCDGPDDVSSCFMSYLAARGFEEQLEDDASAICRVAVLFELFVDELGPA